MIVIIRGEPVVCAREALRTASCGGGKFVIAVERGEFVVRPAEVGHEASCPDWVRRGHPAVMDMGEQVTVALGDIVGSA